MNATKFKPEGWKNEILSIEKEEEIENYIHSGEILQGIVKKCDEMYNLHIELGKGMEGIIPREEVEVINVEENGLPKTNLCTGKVNRFIQFKMKEKKNEKQVILSRKQVQEDALNWVKQELKEGQILTGIVKNIKPYGAFIEIGGGIVGLVHIEDLSVARIKTPFERLKIGQTIKVIVKYIDKSNGRVNLSYKELLGTWEENVKQFKPKMKTTGIVREIEKNKNGIFIELTPNLVGMAEYQEGLVYGQSIHVFIKKIDTEKKKIKLTVI